MRGIHHVKLQPLLVIHAVGKEAQSNLHAAASDGSFLHMAGAVMQGHLGAG